MAGLTQTRSRRQWPINDISDKEFPWARNFFSLVAFPEPISKTLYGVNVTQLSNKMSAMDREDDAPDGATKPGLSSDSQSFIGLKLRELYDDVVAEPVPDRLLELLGKLGEDDTTSKKK